MKANYLQKNRSGHPYLKQVLTLAVIFVLGAIAFSFFDRIIISTFSPIWKAENVITRNLRNSIAFFSLRTTLIEENTRLKEKLSSLELELMSLSSGQTQESVLLELAGRRQVLNAITATVLTHPPQTPYDIIIIDAGSKDSIDLGSEVSLPEGPILGIVSEVFPSKARVKLFSSAGEETNALLERGNMPVVLVGHGGGNFKLILPREIEVAEGDRILSLGIVPRLLAIVENVSIRSTDSFKEVLAKSPTNIFTLRFVFVMP